jgi:hypothetical protein
MSDPKEVESKLQAIKTKEVALANTEHSLTEAFVLNATPSTTFHSMKTENNTQNSGRTFNRQHGDERHVRTEHSSDRPFTPPATKTQTPAAAPTAQPATGTKPK